ncbi:MAG: ROK family protein [Pseudomonadota bacterium]
MEDASDALSSGPDAVIGFGPIRPAAGETAPPLRRQVLECVRSHGAIPRVDVAKHLAVSPASVTVAVTELMALGLVREVAAPSKPNGRGRPPVALSVEPSAGYVAGIKLSEPVSTAILTDFAGEPRSSVSVPASGVRSVHGLLDEAAHLLNTLIEKAACAPDAVQAVGLGLPGTVDYTAGEVLWSPILHTQSVPLRRLASDRLGRPVEVDNDANLVTLAELWFGAGRRLKDFAVITIEHGVGMGLVMDHQLHRGANRVGLELGHTTVQIDGALCRCGQRGCLEAYVSDYALGREAATVLGETVPGGEGQLAFLERLHDRAKAGDGPARDVFRRAGRYLALGIRNIISLYDPSAIILSGARLQFDFLYGDEVLSDIGPRRIHAGRVPKIEVNTWGDLVWARGAAALALDRLTERMSTGHVGAARMSAEVVK